MGEIKKGPSGVEGSLLDFGNASRQANHSEQANRINLLNKFGNASRQANHSGQANRINLLNKFGNKEWTNMRRLKRKVHVKGDRVRQRILNSAYAAHLYPQRRFRTDILLGRSHKAAYLRSKIMQEAKILRFLHNYPNVYFRRKRLFGSMGKRIYRDVQNNLKKSMFLDKSRLL
jgi:hypothetical protein